jgi:hypothetical protein
MTVAERLRQLGIEPRHYKVGSQRLPCPQCDDRPRKGPRECLSFLIDASGATWNCHRCGYSGGAGNGCIIITSPGEHKPERTPDRNDVEQYAARVWAETLPIEANSIAGRYLLARGCALPPRDSDLRWHPNLRHAPSRRMFPAMVGLVTDALDCRKRLGLHRTFLAHDGSGKADVDSPKMYLGHVTGGCVRVWNDESVTIGLGIAEGIETALSLAHDVTPVWACMDAGHLGTFPVLAGIEALTIAVDHDQAGLDAAKECKQRWLGAGCEVTTIRSKHPAHDLNDEVKVA